MTGFRVKRGLTQVAVAFKIDGSPYRPLAGPRGSQPPFEV